MWHFLLTHRYTVLHPVWSRIHCYTPVPLSASKRVCMLFWSSSASSCSFSHMAACSSASSASSFSSSVRLWLFMNPAMLSTVCCCLFIFLFSPFCLSSASCDYIAYHFSTVLPPVFCRRTFQSDNTVTAKKQQCFVGNSNLQTGQDVQLLYRAYMHAITITLVRALPRHPCQIRSHVL